MIVGKTGSVQSSRCKFKPLTSLSQTVCYFNWRVEAAGDTHQLLRRSNKKRLESPSHNCGTPSGLQTRSKAFWQHNAAAASCFSKARRLPSTRPLCSTLWKWTGHPHLMSHPAFIRASPERKERGWRGHKVMLLNKVNEMWHPPRRFPNVSTLEVYSS